MNANRNQKVAIYRNGKLDHVCQEGNEPAMTKKMSGRGSMYRKKGTPWFVK